MVKCPILYVIGDTLGMDTMLCGRYRAYNYRTCNRLSWSCTITSEHLDNPHYPCEPLEWEHMHHLSKATTAADEATLQNLSQHQLDSQCIQPAGLGWLYIWCLWGYPCGLYACIQARHTQALLVWACSWTLSQAVKRPY